MGHANLENIHRFFVRRIYALGKVSIAQAFIALEKAGETVHSSEGEYEDRAMLGMALAEIVAILSEYHPREGGPWIEPVLTAWHGRRGSVSKTTRRMLDEIEEGANDLTIIGAAADRLEEEGVPAAWPAALRLLRLQRLALEHFEEDGDDMEHDDEHPEDYSLLGNVFDSIPWRFSKGWRQCYREIPIVGNVTN
jgi:hypothetical protein